MSLPFTTDQFLSVFREYNFAVWPAAVVGYIIAISSLVLVYKRQDHAGWFMSAFIALFWVWTGVAYHIVYFAEINKVAYGFGSLFALQGVLLFWHGVIRRRAVYTFSWTPKAFVGGLFMIYALMGYSFLAFQLGHVFPRTPVFPISPCPLTIFTFGLFFLSKDRIPWYLWAIPFIWSLVGFAAATKLGMLEDYGLIVAGVVGSVWILVSNYKLGKIQPTQ
jgi:hypothetical protein